MHGAAAIEYRAAAHSAGTTCRAAATCFSNCWSRSVKQEISFLLPDHVLNHIPSALCNLLPRRCFHHKLFLLPQRCVSSVTIACSCCRLAVQGRKGRRGPEAIACRKRPREALAPANICKGFGALCRAMMLRPASSSAAVQGGAGSSGSR
jgi:hypothetical protein